jgi:MFS transporter, YNFM family, putative membrane transport protein
VGLRAETGKAQASSLYLFFYYVGSSLAGSVGGWVFTLGAWPGEAAFIGALSGLALLIAFKLMRVPPPAHVRTP